jgi:hypothetical protein
MTKEKQQPISESEKKKEDWMNSKWRPMMGWMYMAVCACDFMLFPVLWSLLQAVMKVGTMAQWQPLTLQGAGLFHIAMGAVLGIAAMGRTQEKIAGANNGGAGASAPGGFSVPSTPAAPSFGSGMFGSAPTPATTYTPAPSWGTTPVAADPSQVVSGFGGKAAPVIPPFPER